MHIPGLHLSQSGHRVRWDGTYQDCNRLQSLGGLVLHIVRAYTDAIAGSDHPFRVLPVGCMALTGIFCTFLCIDPISSVVAYRLCSQPTLEFPVGSASRRGTHDRTLHSVGPRCVAQNRSLHSTRSAVNPRVFVVAGCVSRTCHHLLHVHLVDHLAENY